MSINNRMDKSPETCQYIEWQLWVSPWKNVCIRKNPGRKKNSPQVFQVKRFKEQFPYKRLSSVKPTKRRWGSTYRSALEESYYHSYSLQYMGEDICKLEPSETWNHRVRAIQWNYSQRGIQLPQKTELKWGKTGKKYSDFFLLTLQSLAGASHWLKRPAREPEWGGPQEKPAGAQSRPERKDRKWSMGIEPQTQDSSAMFSFYT